MKIKTLIASASLSLLVACGGGGFDAGETGSGNGGGTVSITLSTAEVTPPSNLSITALVASDTRKKLAVFWSADGNSFSAADIKLYEKTCSTDCLGQDQVFMCDAVATPEAKLTCGSLSGTVTASGHLIVISCDTDTAIDYINYYKSNQIECSIKSVGITFNP